MVQSSSVPALDQNSSEIEWDKWLTVPIWLPMFLVASLRDWWAVHQIVHGKAEAAWNRLIGLWDHCPTFYGKLVGIHLESRIENDALEKFIKKYPAAEPLILNTLNHPNPMVCAYAFRALWRMRTLQGKPLRWEELPESLSMRNDEIDTQFGCIHSLQLLQDIVRERIESPQSHTDRKNDADLSA